MAHRIIIQDLRIYAYHGVLSQENTIGAYFTISIELTTDFSEAVKTDELAGTISYADVLQVIRREMAVPSKLIEHVGGRIVKALFEEFKDVSHIRLRIIKENPPMGAECAGAGIEIEEARK